MDPSCLVTTVQAAGGGVMVLGDVFLAHFRPLSANCVSFKCHGLPEHCFWPLWHHLMATSSRIMHHVTKLESFFRNGPTYLKNAFSTLLNQCHIELRQFWRRKGVKHSISMVFLIIL